MICFFVFTNILKILIHKHKYHNFAINSIIMNIPETLTFAKLLPECIERYKNNNALGFVGEEATTYEQLGEKIQATIAFLEKHQITKGDKVAIFSQNMPNWGIVYFALQYMGAVAVPLLPDFNKNELKNILSHSETKAIFISKNLEYKLEGVETPLVQTIVRIDDLQTLSNSNTKADFDAEAQATEYTPDENDLAILLYTSGTTGESKGVMLSQRNVIINSIQAGAIQPIEPKDRFLSVLPLSHTYENTLGLILPMLSGAGVTYLRKPPTAAVLLPAMQEVKPHLMLTVPLIMEKVYKNSVLPKIKAKFSTRALYNFKPSRKLVHRIAGKKLYQSFGGNLKFFGIGGAKLNAEVECFLRDAKFPYAIGYGLTETAPIIAGSNPSQTKHQAIGPKVIHCEMKIHNPDAKTKEGEILVKGPNIMMGYYKNEEKTKEVFTEDGWFKTGDTGVFDENGWLMHKGRIKNMIVGSNGENIYPEEIETLINNFRHVVESIVVEKKGKLVALVHFNKEELEEKLKHIKEEINNKIDQRINELSDELMLYINSHVNKFSRIQQVVIYSDPFKRTATQKIKRYLYH
jgi:long-chain acyl-CoA synthetase